MLNLMTENYQHHAIIEVSEKYKCRYTCDFIYKWLRIKRFVRGTQVNVSH